MDTLEELREMPKDYLVDSLYNTWVYSNADGNEEATEKAIPYMGWFWRRTNFVNKAISIGKHDGYVGVMENNKWGYAERCMTKEEVDTFIEYLDKAIRASRQGGILSEIRAERDGILSELRRWMYSLEEVGVWSEPYD